RCTGAARARTALAWAAAASSSCAYPHMRRFWRITWSRTVLGVLLMCIQNGERQGRERLPSIGLRFGQANRLSRQPLWEVSAMWMIDTAIGLGSALALV